MRWFCMLGVCALGACNGRLLVIMESPAAEEGGVGTEAPDAGAPGDETLPDEPEPLLCSQWDLGYEHRLEAEIECGSCGCFGADRSLCRDSPCPAPRTIRRCTEADDITQAATVGVSRIIGTTWSFSIKGPGGCGEQAEEDFDVCYGPGFYPGEYPYHAAIYALALTSADECDRMAFQHMEVDLAPLAEFASPEGGLVSTGFGDMAVGELTCSDRTLMASRNVDQEVQNSDRRCVVDNDCVPVDVYASCVRLCGPYAIRWDSHPTVIEHAERIAREICVPHATECPGIILESPPPCEAATGKCGNGICYYDQLR